MRLRAHAPASTNAFARGRRQRSPCRIGTAPNHVRAWRRDVYETLGGHNPKYRVGDDHELIVRTYLVTKMKHIEKPLYLQRITGWNTWLQNIAEINTTSNALRAEYLERLVLRECEISNVPAIELGGGIDSRAGWTAADLEGAPITCDLREKWPWQTAPWGPFARPTCSNTCRTNSIR